MPTPFRFPPSAEIKRAIAAAVRAGIDIGSVEIHADKITIFPRHESSPGITDYDLWKLGDQRETSRIQQAVEDSDAPPAKPRG